MSRNIRNILLRTLVFPFYRKNAGQLILVFILFIGAVGELEGTQIHTGPLIQLHYQYQLISGMMNTWSLFLLVLLAWTLYAEKCVRFLISILRQEDHGFLYLLNGITPGKQLAAMYRIQLLLFLPILAYLPAVIGVALYQGRYATGLMVVAFVLGICLVSALRARYVLLHPGRKGWWLRAPAMQRSATYARFLLQYLLHRQKLMLAGLKLFGCGILVVSIRAMASSSYYDLRMPVLLFGIGILGHAVLVFQLRSAEERYFIFYRTLPVPILKRAGQYAKLYLLLMIPELLTILAVTRMGLHVGDACRIFGIAYGLPLLLHSLLFVAPVAIRDLLKILLALYGVLYVFVMATELPWLALAALPVAGLVFWVSYYRYDPAKLPGQ